MGRDKALLEFEGETLVERAVGKLGAVCAEVRIAGGGEEVKRFGAVVQDDVMGCGPLGGIVAGLGATGFDWSVFLAVDVPLVPVEFVQALGERCLRSSAVAVIARVEGRAEVLCAGYSRKGLSGLRKALEEGRLKVLTAVQEAGEVEFFEVDGKNACWFANVNTPEEFSMAKQLAGGKGI
jgi:molybdopterin-guanine dinucleotide biosynthesis protein A